MKAPRLAAAAALLLVLPFPINLAAGAAGYLLLPRLLRALPRARQQDRERERFEHATVLAEALAAHLHAGISLVETLESCAAVDAGDLGQATSDCARLLRMGSEDPFAPWRRWEYLVPLSRELERARTLGGSISGAAGRAAHRLRDESLRRRRMAVERVSVQVTLPVSLCLLPSFLLLAVLPPAVGLIGQLDLSLTSTARR